MTEQNASDTTTLTDTVHPILRGYRFGHGKKEGQTYHNRDVQRASVETIFEKPPSTRLKRYPAEIIMTGVWRVACGVWRVACGVWRVACGVWRVACGVW
ncbi:hypothetical protein, partial [Zymobacter palmae]